MGEVKLGLQLICTPKDRLGTAEGQLAMNREISMCIFQPLRALKLAMFALALWTVLPVFADSLALRYYDDALTRYNGGDSEGALIQLKNSLQHDPTQLPARVLMGQIQLDLGNPLQAEEELLMARKLGADWALVALPLARARNELGKHAIVVEELHPASYPSSLQADLWAELGKARLGSRDSVGADIAFNEALNLVPNHEEVMLVRITELIRRKQFGEAEPLVVNMLSRYPENAQAWFLMGSIYHARGEFESAVAHYRQATALNPRLRRAAMGEALALLDWGKDELGAARLKQIVTTPPPSLEALYFYTKALGKLGRWEESEAALRVASDMVNALTPDDLTDNPGQLLLAATIANANAQYESAYRFLSKYLEHEPQDLAANKRLALLLVRMNKPTEALRLLTRLKASTPEDIELLVMLGDINSNLHDYMMAEIYYQAALDRVDGNPMLVGRLGLSQLRQGETDAAIDTFRHLVEQTPSGNAETSLFLGLLYLREGRLAEARDVANRVVTLQPDNPSALNLQAAATIYLGERANGRSMLEAILATHPDYLPARINLIKLDIIEGRLADADDALAKLLSADPDDLLALNESAQVASARGDRRTAIRYLERIREINPRAARPILQLMGLYLGEDRVTDALKVAQALERAAPDNLMVKKGLAIVQLARGESSIAQSLLDDAVRLAGHDEGELVGIAQLQSRAGAVEAAEQTLRKALVDNPTAAAVRIELAFMLAAQRRFEDAAVEVAAIIEHDPQNLAAIVQLGDIRLDQGRADDAIVLYRRALGLSNQASLVVKLYRAVVRAGHPDQALAELKAWNAAHPDNPPVMLVLADRLQQQGDLDEALGIYLRLANLQPRNFIVYNNLANMLMPVDAERALRAAMHAHELAPDNAAVLDTLGWLRVQVGDLERGLIHLREAAVRNSQSPTIRYHLAVALEEYGNEIEAERELRRALAMKTPFVEREEASKRLRRLEIR